MAGKDLSTTPVIALLGRLIDAAVKYQCHRVQKTDMLKLNPQPDQLASMLHSRRKLRHLIALHSIYDASYSPQTSAAKAVAKVCAHSAKKWSTAVARVETMPKIP